jgi:hypothetical protein
MQANSSVEYFHIFPLLQVEKADIFGLRKKIIFQERYYVSTNQPPSKYDIIYFMCFYFIDFKFFY